MHSISWFVLANALAQDPSPPPPPETPAASPAPLEAPPAVPPTPLEPTPPVGDPVPPPAAPVDLASKVAVLAAGPDSGWKAPESAADASKLTTLLLRCQISTTPAKSPLWLYVPSFEAEGVTSLLDAALGWTPTRFEQHHSKLQAAGTGCRKRTDDVTGTLATARGGVVVVPAGVTLPAGWVVLWEPPHAP